jgi:hypothetical protein
MEREIITIPSSLMRITRVDWDIDWRGQGVGESNAGSGQTIYNAFPRWTGSVALYLRRDSLLQWRAIRAQAQGRVGIYRVPMRDPLGFDAVETGQSYPTGVPFANGQSFGSGYGFAYEPFCTAVNAASAGDTQIRVDASAVGVAPKIGQIMSHNSWPFLVTWVTEISLDVYDIGIQMPLREAIVVDDPVLMQGVGLFEVTEDKSGAMPYGHKHQSTPVFDFREVLNR